MLTSVQSIFNFATFQSPLVFWLAPIAGIIAIITSLVLMRKIGKMSTGGKNSPAHQASVVGDTVGDPMKDTAGPSLHVLIKLLSTLSIVFIPLFINLLHLI